MSKSQNTRFPILSIILNNLLAVIWVTLELIFVFWVIFNPSFKVTDGIQSVPFNAICGTIAAICGAILALTLAAISLIIQYSSSFSNRIKDTIHREKSELKSYIAHINDKNSKLYNMLFSLNSLCIEASVTSNKVFLDRISKFGLECLNSFVNPSIEFDKDIKNLEERMQCSDLYYHVELVVSSFIRLGFISSTRLLLKQLKNVAFSSMILLLLSVILLFLSGITLSGNSLLPDFIRFWSLTIVISYLGINIIYIYEIISSQMRTIDIELDTIPEK